jgi:SAM-dependent methyltransferase
MLRLECFACGATLTPKLDDVRDPQSGEKFEVLGCPACGLGRTSPEPEDLGAYYGPAYYGNRHGFTAKYCARRRARLLERAAGTAGRELFDIGCGDGLFLQEAGAGGWRVHGSEIGGAVELSRRTGIDVRESITDASGLPPFDAITMWHTLEHFRDPLTTLGEARARLAPGGTLIVAVPDAAGLQASMFGSKWFHLDVPRHLHHFNRESLSAVLGKAGFAVRQWEHLELELELFGWLQSALNTLLPTPNALFQSLTGKTSKAGLGQLMASYGLGVALGPAAVVASALGAVTKRTSSLIAIAGAA